MFELDQDLQLGWLGYSHKTQQTHNRATKEVECEHCKFRVVFGQRNAGSQRNLINEEEDPR
jgi:hypothetical protein